jgi:hypothetical protein
VLNQIAAARLACIGQAPQLPSTVSRIHLTLAAPSRDRIQVKGPNEQIRQPTAGKARRPFTLRDGTSQRAHLCQPMCCPWSSCMIRPLRWDAQTARRVHPGGPRGWFRPGTRPLNRFGPLGTHWPPARFTVGGRPGGAYGGVLRRGAGLAVGVVPAEARARRVTQLGCMSLNSLGGGLRPRLLRAAGGARGAAIYPRGAGRGLPTGPGTCEAPCGASPGTAPRGILGKSPRGIACGEVDKKSGAGRAGCPAPVTWTDAPRALPGRARPFASLRQSWLVLAPQDGGDLLGGHAVKVEMNLGG